MIPTVEDVKSSPMTHRFGDLYNPPGLTNFLGSVQSLGHDPVSVRALAFPPFSAGDNPLCALYLDGKFFPTTGAAVTTVWRPDRIERSAEVNGLRLVSHTALVPGQMAVVVRLVIENRSGQARDVSLKLALRGGVTQALRPWADAIPPTEADNAVTVDAGRKALRFEARGAGATLVQGCRPLADEITPLGLRLTLRLGAGESRAVDYAAAIGETAAQAEALYDRTLADAGAVLDAARREWDAELAAIFTPGNGRYSGHLPVLETTDRDVLRAYHIGALGVAYHKRESPHSVHGRVYCTLMPRYWHTVSFLWDYSLSALVHGLLDPGVMKANLRRWMTLDVHKHFGTEYLTGAGVGPWYSVNDFAMSVIAREYLRWTGDVGFLNEPVGADGATALSFLRTYAENWKRFRTPGGLADYGGLNNLLECVNTYLHEVASLNAANVFNMRFAAELADLRRDTDDAARLRREADDLARRVVDALYVDGRGYFRARFPDGTLHEVRHCYDFFTVLNTMDDHVGPRRSAEMVEFFQRELMTPTWLHALSPDDDDAMFSVRPDHQWNGAYPAWPPQAVQALYRVGRADVGFEWFKGLSRSANQGPYGQAHFCESVVAPEAGGAIKAPSDFPYINDWTCSSNGAWCAVVIESIFGVRAGLTGIEASPQFSRFDPKAVLRNLHWQGKNLAVTKDGIVGR